MDTNIMDFPTISYMDDEGNLSSECSHAISDETLVQGYKAMVTTRYVDDRMTTLQRQGRITFAMSSLGEEACAVASAAALSPDDWLYPQYREAGIMYWRGFSIQDFVHSMFCNAKDVNHGRQMPNHFGSRKLNVVTVSSPIGTKIPQVAGAAYAMKIKGEKTVALCYFGEGATSEGDFHAGLNFAAVREAPAIFFCRNNGYAISTPAIEQFRSDGIAPKGAAYGMTTFRVDGNDFFAVHETVAKARAHCIEGRGPVLIEAMTHRIGAHSTSDDPSVYRQEEEVAPWRARDPVTLLGKHLRVKGLWSSDEESDLQAQLKAETDEAINVGKATGKPSLDSLVEEVYFEVPPTLKRQLDEVKNFLAGE
jgi:pyruvate dehydrogenase E1 component alpha subunit